MANQKNSAKEDRSILDKFPTLPFLTVVRRPDYQLRNKRFKLPRTVPTSLIIAMLFTGVLFIYIGGFYDFAEDNVLPFGSDRNNEPVVIAPGMHDQFIFEGMAAGFLMFIGSGGIFLIYYSTRFAYSPKHAAIFLLLGIAIVFLALAPIMLMLIKKVPSLLEY